MSKIILEVATTAPPQDWEELTYLLRAFMRDNFTPFPSSSSSSSSSGVSATNPARQLERIYLGRTVPLHRAPSPLREVLVSVRVSDLSTGLTGDASATSGAGAAFSSSSSPPTSAASASAATAAASAASVSAASAAASVSSTCPASLPPQVPSALHAPERRQSAFFRAAGFPPAAPSRDSTSDANAYVQGSAGAPAGGGDQSGAPHNNNNNHHHHNNSMHGTRGSASSADVSYTPVFFALHGRRRRRGGGGAVGAHGTGDLNFDLNDDEEEDEGEEGEACYAGGGNYNDGDDASAALPSSTVLTLPHASLEGLWESLSYGESEAESLAMKHDLVQYMHAALCLSLAGVDPNQVTWNRLLLFHGPPGTGKTSLCKALAQKLSIHMRYAFPRPASLVEINAHSLFSRWFSESGKQVMLLFTHIRRLAADRGSLVCVLIDEVESLAAARQSAMKGNEPSDSIRVVNALLTQIDRLQRLRNVVVLATSNLTGAIDVAFLDRADKKVYVGPPGLEARRAMLHGSVMELLRCGLLAVAPEASHSGGGGSGGGGSSAFCAPPSSSFSSSVPSSAAVGGVAANGFANANTTATTANVSSNSNNNNHNDNNSNCQDSAAAVSCALTAALAHMDVTAQLCVGLNGRTLKKLPFLAFGRCMAETRPGAAMMVAAAGGGVRGASFASSSSVSPPVTLPLTLFLHHLRAAVLQEQKSRNDLSERERESDGGNSGPEGGGGRRHDCGGDSDGRENEECRY